VKYQILRFHEDKLCRRILYFVRTLRANRYNVYHFFSLVYGRESTILRYVTLW